MVEPYNLLWWATTILGGLVGFAVVVLLWVIYHYLDRFLETRRYYRSTRAARRERIRHLKRMYKHNPALFDPYNPYITSR